MAITRPKFYSAPWAANETMYPLTPDEMAAGYPEGSSEKPTRRSINAALQYAINGVLYYLVTGVPEWVAEGEFRDGSIVRFGESYYRSTEEMNIGEQPDNTTVWEKLPWRWSDLNEIYITRVEAEERFLTPEAGDERYYTQAAADALFLTQADAAILYVTRAAVEAEFITKEQAELLFLTQEHADQLYPRIEDVVTHDALEVTLADYKTVAAAAEIFLTVAQSDERFLREEQATERFLSQSDAQETYHALEDVAFSIYRADKAYAYGVLVLDTASGIVYQSVIDNNLGNPLRSAYYWRPWIIPEAADLNGLFLNCFAMETPGEYEIMADDIPMLADHPEGIFLKVISKGPGGLGGFNPAGTLSVANHGGGEGSVIEAVFQNVKAEHFPLYISVNSENTWVQISGGAGVPHEDAAAFLVTSRGGDGNSDAPGHGGRDLIVDNPAGLMIWHRFIPGADGRWGVPGLRGGDGGGAAGGSGTANYVVWERPALRGCGGGGRTDYWYGLNRFPGSGSVFVYW